MKRKKLLIDANPVVPYYTSGILNGIGRTTLELIRSLDRIPAEDIPFNIELWSQNLRGVGGNNIGTRFKSHHLRFRHTDNWDRWVNRFNLREVMTRYDLLHICHNYDRVNHPERTIFTIHDVFYFSHPEPHFNVQYYCKELPPVARKSPAIITISENSKREITHYMDVPEEKIHVIPWGIDFDILYPHKVSHNSYCGSAPYFVSVSCGPGRKNTISLVKAFAEFNRQAPAHHLILVWASPTDEVLEEICKNKLESKIHFAPNVSNEKLSDLYAGATACFFPTLYEGFGLPIAESMACGTPVVTCDNSCLREVGGDAAIYVEPFDISRMAGVMEQFENGYPDISKLKNQCLNQAKQFTWERCASQTLEVYRNCFDAL